MATMCRPGPYYQVCIDNENFMNQSVPYMLALSCFIAIFAGIAKRCFASEWDPDVFGFTLLFSFVWSFPVMLYFLYHRATLPLPEWLTFGRPVTFGGIADNVCEAGDRGHWPCLPNDLKNWLAGVGRLEWKHMIPREGTVWLCFFFLALNIVLVLIVRRYRQVRRSLVATKDERCRNQEADATLVDATLVELGDMEKQ